MPFPTYLLMLQTGFSKQFGIPEDLDYVEL